MPKRNIKTESALSPDAVARIAAEAALETVKDATAQVIDGWRRKCTEEQEQAAEVINALHDELAAKSAPVVVEIAGRRVTIE
jgi:hypothetical protein